MKTILY